jgi:hypothetical protein
MRTTQSIGRIIGALMLAQMVGGMLVNFVLLAPVTAPPGFLVNAAAHSLQLGFTVLIGLATGALSVAIAITALPLFRRYSYVMALWFPWVLLPALPAELGLCLWLIVKGVDVPKWEARALSGVRI